MRDSGGQDKAIAVGTGMSHWPSERVMSARVVRAHILTAQILWLGSCLFVFKPETLEFLTVSLPHSQMLMALRRSCTFPFFSKLPTSKPKKPQASGESWVRYLIILISKSILPTLPRTQSSFLKNRIVHWKA